MKYRLGVEYSAHESAYDDAYLMQDRDFMYTTDMWRISLQSELTTRKGSWHRSMAWTQISSEDQSDYPGVYKGFNWNSDTYYKTSLSQNHFLLLGLQAGYDVVPDIEEAHVYWYDPYVNWVYAQNKWQVNSGVRYNQHQTYGGHWVYHINPSYTVETAQGSLQWMGTLGSSFISPSLFQLYGPFGANRSLRPEESTNAELGVHWKAKKGYSFELHAYQRQVENAVYWDNTAFAYGNDPVNQRVKGGELQFKSVDFRGFSSQMSYAFVDAQGLSGLRIPRHRWTAFAQYKSTREQTWSMSGVWTGKREDMDFTEYTLVDLAPFYTVDFSWTYTSQSAPWQLQLSMRNATDQQFVEQWGYNTLGRMFQAGLFYRLKS
jgi:vitamin B12 transporter